MCLAASTSTDAAPVEILAGDLDEAEALLRAMTRDLEVLGESYLRSSVVGAPGHVLVRKGDVAEGRARRREAAALAALDDVDAQVAGARPRSVPRAHEGELDEAPHSPTRRSR